MTSGWWKVGVKDTKTKNREDQSAQVCHMVNGVLDITSTRYQRDLSRKQGQRKIYYSLPGCWALKLYQLCEKWILRDAEKGTALREGNLHGSKCS